MQHYAIFSHQRILREIASQKTNSNSRTPSTMSIDENTQTCLNHSFSVPLHFIRCSKNDPLASLAFAFRECRIPAVEGCYKARGVHFLFQMYLLGLFCELWLSANVGYNSFVNSAAKINAKRGEKMRQYLVLVRCDEIFYIGIC
jgi:ABC-type sulfate/molybdate transport systems ATPase subunit